MIIDYRWNEYDEVAVHPVGQIHPMHVFFLTKRFVKPCNNKKIRVRASALQFKPIKLKHQLNVCRISHFFCATSYKCISSYIYINMYWMYSYKQKLFIIYLQLNNKKSLKIPKKVYRKKRVQQSTFKIGVKLYRHIKLD